MGLTVSTVAFDAILEIRDKLCVWTARGFVSDGLCGFDLNITSSQADSNDLEEFLPRLQWWDLDSVSSGMPMSLLRDGVGIPLSVVAGSSNGGQSGENLQACLSLSFPTQVHCSSLTFMLNSKPWPVRSASFNPGEVSASLARLRHIGSSRQ